MRNVKSLLENINLKKFNKIASEYVDLDNLPTSPSNPKKFFDIRKWMKTNLLRVRELGLHKSKKLKILDVSTGMGYFPFICNQYGHFVKATDTDHFPQFAYYERVVPLLGIERHMWFIERQKPAPNLGRFDLITSFMITFDRDWTTDEDWTVDDWDYFVKDLKDNLLAKNGTIYLSFNDLYRPIRKYFVSIGAQVKGKKVKIH